MAMFKVSFLLVAGLMVGTVTASLDICNSTVTNVNATSTPSVLFTPTSTPSGSSGTTASALPDCSLIVTPPAGQAICISVTQINCDTPSSRNIVISQGSGPSSLVNIPCPDSAVEAFPLLYRFESEIQIFHDGSLPVIGWNMTYFACDQTDDICDVNAVNATSDPQTLISPNYPDLFPLMLDCQVSFGADTEVSPGCHVEVSVTSASLRDCNHTLVLCQNGTGCQSLCSTSGGVVTADLDSATLQFTSLENVPSDNGFQLEYSLHTNVTDWTAWNVECTTDSCGTPHGVCVRTREALPGDCGLVELEETQPATNCTESCECSCN